MGHFYSTCKLGEALWERDHAVRDQDVSEGASSARSRGTSSTGMAPAETEPRWKSEGVRMHDAISELKTAIENVTQGANDQNALKELEKKLESAKNIQKSMRAFV